MRTVSEGQMVAVLTIDVEARSVLAVRGRVGGRAAVGEVDGITGGNV